MDDARKPGEGKDDSPVGPGAEESLTGTVSDGPPAGRELALTTDVLPVDLPIIPLFGRPMFPVQSVPIVLDEQPWVKTLVEMRDAGESMVGLLLARNTPAPDPGGAAARGAVPQAEELHRVGTVAAVHQAAVRDGKIQLLVEGRRRLRVERWLVTEPPLRARVSYPALPESTDEPEQRAYAMAIIGLIKKLVPLNPLYNEELKAFLERFTPNQPAFLADFAANLTTAGGADLQNVLETFALVPRMQAVLNLLHKELEVVELHARIRSEVEKRMSEQQRRFFLNEQLKAIQEELGISKDDRTADVERFQDRVLELELGTEAEARFSDELQKLSVLEPGSPEYAVTRNYLEWLTSLPWGRYSTDNLDLERARRILDADHTGLGDVKDRIVEFLAVGKLRGRVSGSIILLVGPPGVGKTSVGRSIAAALDREFYRFSLGGMRDEAEIKGHRRTYIGAMPGKFIQALKSVGVANPVIMLDEIDKVGASYHGDPASSLLEVLDPEQNTDFLDHYVDVRFDLSSTLFVCTANQLDTIPRPLLDRMEVIRLSGYVAQEKLAIAKKHLLPRQLERAGVAGRDVSITDGSLRRIIEGYAREAGVRGLEQQIARVLRKAAVEVVGRPTRRRARPIRVTVDTLESYLGKPIFGPERPPSGVGVIAGLAWTPLGGAILPIEATLVHSKQRGFRLTGNLGAVMKESAEIAYSHVAANLARYGCDPGFLDDAFVHLHVPEGATPKDGPSAGVTMATALVSLARGRRIRRSTAMTGELTLTGQVLPVGGIREKIVAARRGRLFRLIVPEANRRDLEEFPEFLRDGLEVTFAARYADVYAALFSPAPDAGG